MTEKAMTITLYFDANQSPPNIRIGQEIQGAKVTAMSIYDLFETMEIAKNALEECGCDVCEEAKEKIDKVINKACDFSGMEE